MHLAWPELGRFWHIRRASVAVGPQPPLSVLTKPRSTRGWTTNFTAIIKGKMAAAESNPLDAEKLFAGDDADIAKWTYLFEIGNIVGNKQFVRDGTRQ